ncbi:MAG: hypothetical protein ACJ8HQ_07615 [Chthoniobacterales bacterium]
MAPMLRAASFVILAGVVVAGCTATKKAAVTTFHVIDAPANYVRHKIDEPQTTTTTTTTASDVSNPGYAVNQPPPQVTTQHHAATTAVPSPSEGPRKVPPGPSPHAAATQASQFPVARSVPGRPGYVYSIDPNGGIIDVTGYKSGDKAKDPYTKQNFIVP